MLLLAPILKNYGRFCKESVYFYTFHKSGSTLLHKFLDQNVYLRRFFVPDSRLSVENIGDSVRKKGFIYSPIRISNPWILPNTHFYHLIRYFCDSDFIKDKTTIFMIRDPRDILVSSHYYFTSINTEKRLDLPEDMQVCRKKLKQKMLSMSLDEYALEDADRLIIPSFGKLDELATASKRNVILKYEDMIANWDVFAAGLTKYITFRQDSLSSLFQQSRPKEIADKTEHRRSGKIEQFRYELKEETLEKLNDKLKPILERFQYPVK